MGKLKKKSHNEDEHFRGVIRELQKRVKELEKELKTYKKRESLYENNKEEIQEILTQQEAEIEKVANCPKCNKGKLKIILDLNDRQIFQCDECEFRKSVKL